MDKNIIKSTFMESVFTSQQGTRFATRLKAIAIIAKTCTYSSFYYRLIIFDRL